MFTWGTCPGVPHFLQPASCIVYYIILSLFWTEWGLTAGFMDINIGFIYLSFLSMDKNHRVLRLEGSFGLTDNPFQESPFHCSCWVVLSPCLNVVVVRSLLRRPFSNLDLSLKFCIHWNIFSPCLFYLLFTIPPLRWQHVNLFLFSRVKPLHVCTWRSYTPFLLQTKQHSWC